MVLFNDLRDWLLANDPAFSRLRTAWRVTVIIIIAFLVMIIIDRTLVPMPVAGYALAIMLAMQGELAVHDPTPRERLTTRLYAAVASIVTMAVAAVLEPYRIITDSTYLVVIFLAVYGRGFGVRWNAVGIFAFMSYFVGAYFHPSLKEIPIVALGPIIAAITNYSVRTFLLPDNWQRDMMTGMQSVLGRVDVILKLLAQLGRRKHLRTKDVRELHRCQARLGEAVVMAQGMIPNTGKDILPGEGDPAIDLTIHLFDLHLAAESAIVLSEHRLAGQRLVKAVLKHDDEAADREAKHCMMLGKDEAETAQALLWVRDARKTLITALQQASETHFAGFDKPAPEPPQVHTPTFSLKDPTLRTALQVTLASGVAMVFGLMLSRQRWFWAVLAAFLVFINTKSRGDTTLKAYQRTLGTLIGIVIGMLTASIIGDHVVVIVSVAIVCVFLGIYFVRVSYTVMIFFVTIVICLLYGYTDNLTFQLLRLRLEETMIGAIAGVVAAYFVFPVRTEDNLEKAVDKWFSLLRELLETATKDSSHSKLIALTIQLDNAYRDIAVASKPLSVFWAMGSSPAQLRKTLNVFMGCTYWARIFAGRIAFGGIEMKDETREMIAADLARVDALSKQGASFFFDKAPPAPPPGDRLLALSGKDLRLGVEKIGMYLDRLYTTDGDENDVPASETAAAAH